MNPNGPARGRLLAVSGVPPWPPTGGFSLRTAYLLEELAKTWDISLVVASEQDPSEVSWPDPNRHEVISAPVKRRWKPVPARRADLNPLIRAVDAVVKTRHPAAALLFNGAEFLAFEGNGLPPAVADRVDCGALERFRYIRRARYLKPLTAIFETASMARYERRVARELAATIVVGEDDAKVLERISGSSKIHIVPNGVHAQTSPAFERESASPTIVFAGTLWYYPNVDAVRYFVRKLWPSIKKRVRDARLVVAGRNPNRRVLSLDGVEGVEIRPNVKDMSAVLQEAWVTVAPMRCGAGIKNKILESWAAGRPAVMTPRAANGLSLDNGMRGLVAGSDAAFSNLVVELLANQPQRHDYARAAHALALEKHSWSDSGRTVSQLLETAAGF